MVPSEPPLTIFEKQAHCVFQCANYLTLYDQKYGDPEAGIQAGTAFEDLPEKYKCHVCEGGKSEFYEMTL